MKKRFERYFGSNIGRKIYVVCIALIAAGAIIGYGYWWGYGMPLIIIGAAGFFVTAGIQVSDKDVDEHINTVVEEYKKKIDGRVIGKDKLDARDFSVFQGFIREDNETRFKAGTDKRVRTSKFYITALYADSKNFVAFTTVYDLLSDETPNDSMIFTKGADAVEFSSETIEFPTENKKCTLRTTRNGATEELVFFLPNDALADKLIAKLK